MGRSVRTLPIRSSHQPCTPRCSALGGGTRHRRSLHPDLSLSFWRSSKTSATSRAWRCCSTGKRTSSACTADPSSLCCLASAAACPRLWRRGPFHEKGANHHHCAHHAHSVLGAHCDNLGRGGDLRRSPVRACHLPYLPRAHHRVREAAEGNRAGKDGGARARNSTHTEAGARPDPEEDVAADEGVSLHRRALAHRGKHRVRMAGADRPQSFIEAPMAPITVGILGLPSFTAICLIYGVLRKEMAVEC